MALNIKNPEVERLAEEVARLTNSSKTEAIRQALLDRRERVAILASAESREESLLRFFRDRVWPQIPKRARRRLSKQQEEAILGYGEFGEPV
jgi:antitoxin VapB